jgi:hypothetical protein
MAFAPQLTKISVNASKRPTGITDPGGANLASSQPTYQNLKLSILRSTVQNASKALTFDHIRTDAAIGIEKQIVDKLASEIDASVNTVTYNIDWKDILNNRTFNADFYGTGVEVYYAIVDVYVNIS